MSNHFGNIFASIPGSGFRLSTASGHNPFNKSRQGISSSNSSNKFMNLFGNPTTNERRRLLNDTIDKIIIGIEPIGTGVGHGISYYGKGIRFFLPTYLGGGSFVYHLSCLLTLRQSQESVILEFGAYYGGEDG